MAFAFPSGNLYTLEKVANQYNRVRPDPSRPNAASSDQAPGLNNYQVNNSDLDDAATLFPPQHERNLEREVDEELMSQYELTNRQIADYNQRTLSQHRNAPPSSDQATIFNVFDRLNKDNMQNVAAVDRKWASSEALNREKLGLPAATTEDGKVIFHLEDGKRASFSLPPGAIGGAAPYAEGEAARVAPAPEGEPSLLTVPGPLTAPDDPTLNPQEREKVEKQLQAIRDEDIRRALDINQQFDMASMMDWDEDKLNQYVNQIDPENLSVVMKRRLQSHEMEHTRELSWHNIDFTSRDGKRVLNNCSGYINTGMIVGVLGAPDSGVTTLLNILANRQHVGKIKGQVLYDGRTNQDAGTAKKVGYVVKDDQHISRLTVFETLYFSARLRIPSSIPDKMVRARVRLVMKLLGLSHVANTVVGDAALRGVSGGEKRRVSFGIEMIAGHNIIIADLPTNGLDSASAYSLIRTMRFTCKGGFSMLTSVVQPSPELFRLFHRIILMAKGSVIYFGPVTHVEHHLASLGFMRPAKKPLPQFIEELSAQPEQFWKGSIERLHETAQSFIPKGQSEGSSFDSSNSALSSSNLARADIQKTQDKIKNLNSPSFDKMPGVLQARVDAFNVLLVSYYLSMFYDEVERELLKQVSDYEDHKADKHHNHHNHHEFLEAMKKSHSCWTLTQYWWYRYNSSPWLQFTQNFYRQSILTFRNTGLWRDCWITSMCMGFLLGSLFYKVDIDEKGIRNRVGLFFFIMSYFGFNAVQLVPVLSSQREVYYMQIESGYYHPFAYYWPMFILQIPLVFVDTLILMLPVHGLAHLTGDTFISGEFWFGVLMFFINSLVSRVFMILVFALSPNEVYADVLNTVTNILFTKLCGYFIAADSIVKGWYWVYTISYFTYTLIGVSINDVSPLYNGCTPSVTDTCRFQSGVDGLHVLYNMDGTEDKWALFVKMIWFLITFNFAACLALSYVNWSQLDNPEGPNWGAAPSEKFDKTHSRITIPDNAAAEENLAISVEMVPQGDSGAAVQSSQQLFNGRRVNTTHSKLNLGGRKAYLEWKDLCYTVMVGKEGGGTEPRMLLNNVYGYVLPGQMVGLMGASGAGKSTLLDVLAGKKTGGTITGELLVNGRAKDRAFSRIAGYVEQFDSHNAFSTVREAIEFSGRLRLPQNLSNDELQKKVDDVMNVLGLSHLAHEIIGSPGLGGVSPEVRKKVTIAVELIMEPSLLFLDEPTTGLDAQSSFAVLFAVQTLAKNANMACLCTIHQPSTELLEMFDSILFMKAGGEVAFTGPLSTVNDYFVRNHLAVPAAAGRNMADYALEAIKVRAASKQNMLGEECNLNNLFRESPEGRQILSDLDKTVMPEEEKARYQPPNYELTHATLPVQLRALTPRFFWSFVRDTPVIAIRFFLALFMGFVVGTVFVQLGDTQVDGDLRVSAIFVTLIFVMFTSNAFMPEIFFARPVYFREIQSDMYYPIAFYIARYLADIVFVLVENFILAIMIYFIAGFNDQDHSKRFGWFYFTLLAVRWTSIIFTHLVSTVIESPNFANNIQATVFNVMMVFTGFIIPGPSVPDWWIWLYDLSFLKYALHFTAANEARGEDYTCGNLADPSNTGRVLATSETIFNGQCPTPSLLVTGDGGYYKCEYQCGYDLLDAYGVKYSTGRMALNIVVVWLFMGFFLVIGFFALKYINHIKR